MSGISIHVIDVSRGVPAAGMRVVLSRLEPEPRVLAEASLDRRGMLDDPVTTGTGIVAGRYRAEFHVAAYYRGEGLALPDPAFLEVAPFEFGVADTAQHYHLPLKLTPWGFSLFRGGA